MRLPSSDVLDAYRADLTNAGRLEFTRSDAAWLQFGVLLQRATGLSVEQRRTHLRSGATAIAAEHASWPAALLVAAIADEVDNDDRWNEAICNAVLSVANDAEDAGAFAVATAMLDSARMLVGIAEFRLQGRLLAQQARILRKIGELDVASELYDEVANLGDTHGDSELIARACLGKAVVARVRGNYPEARRRFMDVVALPDSTDAMRDLHAHAYHGLLVAAAVARDFDAALRHGRSGLDRARDENYRAELLINLASVCLDVGQHRAALNGFLEALARTHVVRVRLSAFGSAASAAARLGDRHCVDELVEAGLRLVTTTGHEYEIADMLREFAEAYDYLGERHLAQRFRHDALKRARRGEFFEIVHRLDHPPRVPNVAPAPQALAADALDIAEQLAAGDSGELLVAAINSDRWDSYSPSE